MFHYKPPSRNYFLEQSNAPCYFCTPSFLTDLFVYWLVATKSKPNTEAVHLSSSPLPPTLNLKPRSIPMFLEPNPFVENGQGQGYYQKSNSRSPTQSPRNDAHPISKQEPPATPTPSAVDHYHHHANEPPSRRPQFQPVTTLQIPIPRRAEPSSPDMTRPPHPSAVPASVHAQAALRRPAYSVPIVPKPSPPQPSLKKGFHVVKYEVKQERYYLHPSLKGQKISPPAKHHPPPPPSYNTNSMPPSDTTHHNNNHMVPSIESNGSSSGDEDSNSDSNGESDEGEEDDSEPEDANSSSEEEEEVVPKPKPGKRKRAAGMGPIKFKEEAGSSFIDKNAHIKRPRNAWIHVSPIMGKGKRMAIVRYDTKLK